ncbi:glutamyl-tRNA reductase [Bacillus sp. FJAT-29790]|uniref:glutamyl-tRNA reductase n=1 Tax=Bacillus sp. FJAT-29790 TaxID=1895002 RepID=UPI00349F4E24
MQSKNGINENVILSTCNRTEVYAVTDDIETGKAQLENFLAEWFQIEKVDFFKYLFFYIQEFAIKHLFKVTCGLNSKVLGETQILGQVRTSFLLAQKEHTTGTILNHSFKKAVTIGKRAHSETEIGSRTVSVSYAAVEVARETFTTLKDISILVLGAGEMSELLVKDLLGSGANKVSVINRTYENARILAQRYSIEALPFGQLQSKMNESDLVISATSAEKFIITQDMIQKIQNDKALVFMDISVPRSIDEAIKDIGNVRLFNIDDLHDIINTNLLERKKAAKKILTLINGEIDEFMNWVNLLDVVPLISALNHKISSVKNETLESINRKLPDLSNRDKKVITKHLNSIANQFLKAPLSYIKEIAVLNDADQEIDLVTKVFQLEDDVGKYRDQKTFISN